MFTSRSLHTKASQRVLSCLQNALYWCLLHILTVVFRVKCIPQSGVAQTVPITSPAWVLMELPLQAAFSTFITQNLLFAVYDVWTLNIYIQSPFIYIYIL